MTNTTEFVAGPADTAFLKRRWPAADDGLWASLLLVHGLYEHSGRWDHVGSYFAARGYDVTMFDLRGHGQTSGPWLDVTPFAVFVDDLQWMLGETATAGRPLLVYAHSTGALVGCMYAMDSVRPSPDAWVWSAPLLGHNTPRLLVSAGRALARVAPGFRMSDKPTGPELCSDPSVGEAYHADPLVRFKVTTRMGTATIDAIDNAAASLDRIDARALVMQGTDDGVVPPAATAPLAAVPGVDRKLFAGMRHEIHNEPDYEEVLAYADNWFRSATSG